MATVVTGEVYAALDGQLHEIKNQLRLAEYPYDPAALKIALQNAIEGKFLSPTKTATSSSNLFRLAQDRKSMRVNLDFTPTLPFTGAKIERNSGMGWVKVELRNDELYIDGSRYILHLEDGQKNGKSITGRTLSNALSSKDTLHPNVLDALMLNMHFLPESYKRDGDGNIRFICFWGVEFSRAGGFSYVRYLHWNDGAWQARFAWLDDVFGKQFPAVLRAT